MSYILKNTQGLVNTQITDTARKKISQGSFNIAYFQIGDSEVSYNALPNTYGQTNTKILMPAFNAQNSAGIPDSNKHNVKYPYYVDGITGNTYGIPFMDSIVSPVYNRAVMRGFFSGDTSQDKVDWSALTNSQYVINSNYVVKMSSLNCTNKITVIHNLCTPNPVRGIQPGDIITIYYDGCGLYNCSCGVKPTTTTTTTVPPTTTTTTTIPPTTTTTTTQQIVGKLFQDGDLFLFMDGDTYIFQDQ